MKFSVRTLNPDLYKNFLDFKKMHFEIQQKQKKISL